MLVEDGNGRPGVDSRDVPMLLRMQQGQSFQVIQAPRAAKPAPAKPAPVPTREVESPAWDEGVMASPEAEKAGYAETFDVTSLSVKRVKELDINEVQARIMLKAESENKNRKTVIAHLEKIISAG